MKQEDIRKLMARHGKFVRYEGPRKKGIYAMACQGCGKTIYSDTGGQPLGAVLTRRGTLMIWHAECEGKITDNKILWETDK